MPFVLGITVHPEIRRQGIGRQLVGHAVSVAAKGGASVCPSTLIRTR
ncbi:MAG: GNAT family N-acetyltransferase [Chloroflexota bacterium]